MRYFPVFLDLRGKACLVVGGGQVAQRKSFALLKAGAKVTVVSPQLTERLKKAAAQGKLTWRTKEYSREDIKGAHLVFAATSSRETNQQVAKEGTKRGILVNVVDVPSLCSFIVPSVVSRGELIIAISTSGQSPALAKKIRQELECRFGLEYAWLLTTLGRVRAKLLTEGRPSAINKTVFRRLVQAPLLKALRLRNWGQVDALLTKTVGPGYSLSSLGVRLPRMPR